MPVRPATADDVPDWVRLRLALWPHGIAKEFAAEIEAILRKSDAAGFIARDSIGAAVGFAEVALRHDYVNGTKSSPVGFLEGIYVEPSARRGGIARELCEAIARWTREHGCRELASDALLDNTVSHAMHEALGFEETERVVYYRMNVGA